MFCRCIHFATDQSTVTIARFKDVPGCAEVTSEEDLTSLCLRKLPPTRSSVFWVFKNNVLGSNLLAL